MCEFLGFNLGSALKYALRYDKKGSAIQDLEKAIDYIEREVSFYERFGMLSISDMTFKMATRLVNCMDNYFDHEEDAFKNIAIRSIFLILDNEDNPKDFFDRFKFLVQNKLNSITPKPE